MGISREKPAFLLARARPYSPRSAGEATVHSTGWHIPGAPSPVRPRGVRCPTAPVGSGPRPPRRRLRPGARAPGRPSGRRREPHGSEPTSSGPRGRAPGRHGRAPHRPTSGGPTPGPRPVGVPRPAGAAPPGRLSGTTGFGPGTARAHGHPPGDGHHGPARRPPPGGRHTARHRYASGHQAGTKRARERETHGRGTVRAPGGRQGPGPRCSGRGRSEHRVSPVLRAGGERWVCATPGTQRPGGRAGCRVASYVTRGAGFRRPPRPGSGRRVRDRAGRVGTGRTHPARPAPPGACGTRPAGVRAEPWGGWRGSAPGAAGGGERPGAVTSRARTPWRRPR